MSRVIHNLRSISDTVESKENSGKGKILFTKVRNTSCGLFLRDNHLVCGSFMTNKKRITAGIYVARIKDISKELNAYFVEISKNEICYLPMDEVFSPFLIRESSDSKVRTLHQGDLILVQGIREAHKTKLPSVTSRVSIYSPYFVISIGKPKTGYSTKLSLTQKKVLKKHLSEHSMIGDDGNLLPFNQIYQDDIYASSFPSVGIIVRTNASTIEKSILFLELTNIVNCFFDLLKRSMYLGALSCVKEPSQELEEILIHFGPADQVEEIVTDDPLLYQNLLFQDLTLYKDVPIRLYQDNCLSLEQLYGLSTKVDNALQSHIWLKSGAYLVIEETEALTVIDVNSGKFEMHKGDQDYYTKVNIEAAIEIATQIRLRNISGIIIIDFINMKSSRDNEVLLDLMKQHTINDPVRTKIVDITPLGLMEITRQKNLPCFREQAIKAGYPIER